MKPFTLIAIIVFALVAAMHLLRASLGWEVRVEGLVVPVWASFVVGLAAAILSLMLWREHRAPRAP